ncbi:MAG: UDP-N-acetylglucosamine 2-epimerase (non-hydrolyzing) [Chloroflexi bacterium]|nr:UDP-N-acetylglucosamine 2-epimerase (non-hydrolyzing) [Chloroflexota bacterium]
MSAPLLVVVGARPNIVKVAPVWHALAALGIEQRLLHTGQHYDYALSGSFLRQLDLPDPDIALGIGSGTHGEQTAAALVGVERVLLEDEHAAIVVAGDVNSTLAAALAAVKVGLPVIHLEAGLRSADWTMPEEVNRVVCDRISNLLLCTSAEALDALAAEGIDPDRAVLVGNTMIDTLLRLSEPVSAAAERDRLSAPAGQYILVTLHRPAVVDDRTALAAVMGVLTTLAERLPVLFPVHPRTRARLIDIGWPADCGVRLLEPLSYVEFIALEAGARLVITDSGGVQEETSALGIPCLTYRTTTERPVTVELGTNRVVGVDPGVLLAAARGELTRPFAVQPCAIPLWDGQAGSRAAAAIVRYLS